jgi:hypothetical protein
VARGSDGTLNRITKDSSGAWGAWTEIGVAGGSGVGSPTVASWGPNRLDWFVRGEGNNWIWQKTLSNGVMTTFAPLGAILTADPGATETPTAFGGIDIMGLGDNVSGGSPSNAVWHKTWRP